jgi:hypothetical protein
MLSLIAGLDLGEGLSQQAGSAARGRWRAKVEGGQAGWPRGKIRRRGVLANKLAANGIYGVRMCCNLDRWRVAVEKTSSPDAGRL